MCPLQWLLLWLSLSARHASALGAACSGASRGADDASAACVAADGFGKNVSLLQVKAATEEGGAAAYDEELDSGELGERRLEAAPPRGVYTATARVVVDEGGDVGRSFHLPSCPAYPQECEAICTKRAGCKSFAYSPEPWNCRCYFKDKCISSADPVVSASAPNYHYKTYYRACLSYSVTERVVQDEGQDVGPPTYAVANPDVCERICDQRSGCNSFAYSRWLEVCWYKDKIVSPSDPIVGPNAHNNHFQTYYKAATQDEGGAYSATARVVLDEGSDVGSSFHLPFCPAYPQECEAICTGRAGCKSFAYSSEPWNCRCYFKDKCVSGADPVVSESAPNYHYKTYYRACSSYSVTDRVVQDEGHDVGPPTYDVTNPERCQRICDERPSCQSFAYSHWLEVCWYKDKCVSPADPIVGPSAENGHFQTHYKVCWPEPTSSPTVAPTTAAPTPSPTTLPPTASPTPSPTTPSPTAPPTPSPSPTAPPTPSPTAPPTPSPTAPPTPSPTAPPTTPTTTPSPTVAPTRSPTPSPTSAPSPPPPGQLSSVVDTYGRLAVSGTKIVSPKTGEVVRLKGMSFFWSQWGGTWYSRDVVRWLVNDWKVTVLRAAMGIRDDGYLGYPDREKQKVIDVVDACIEAGIYVIIDWHVDGTDTPYADRAVVFFEEMTARYGSSPHVMWEPWNEPTGSTNWLTQIKPYHEMMVPLIRQRSPDNIIILGSRSWCQEVGEASRNPVAGSNLVYALHFYASHHDEAEREKAREALSNGVAIFATEWGAPSYTCQTGIDWGKVEAWTDFLDRNDISDAGWSINDKDETCSALKPFSNPQGSWSASELTESGTYFRGAIRAYNR